MNHYSVDVLAYRLEKALFAGTVVTDVTITTVVDVRSAARLSIGDAIVVTRLPAGTTHNAIISNIVGQTVTFAPAVAGISVDDEVQLLNRLVDHSLYNYNAIDPTTGEPPSMERPFIVVTLPHQVPQLGPMKANVWQQPQIDKTRAAVYIEGRMAIDSGGVRTGGYEVDMRPAIDIVREFVHDNPALVIPVALNADFRDGKIGMIADNPPEIPIRGKGFERHVFYMVLTFMTTTA